MDTPIRKTPSGHYHTARQEKGEYFYFVPVPLPPTIEYDNELMFLAMEAQRYLSELGARSNQIPNPHLFIQTFMRKEAEFSCKIEGTVSSIRDAIEEEAGLGNTDQASDRMDIVNYLKSLSKGLKILDETDISNWFIRGIHEQLIEHQPHKNPGQFRKTQNQIGGIPGDPTTADFIPPEPVEMLRCMDDLIAFSQTDHNIAPLIKVALFHAQFETIHPFDDGNGRVGRQLITFQLCKESVIDKPILYLSYYFKKHKEEYNARLQSLHDNGSWEDWLKFFFSGIIETCKNALRLAEKIMALATDSLSLIGNHYGSGKQDSPSELLYFFFMKPIMSVPEAVEQLRRSKGYVYDLFNTFCELGLIEEFTQQDRNKKYAFSAYLDLLETDEH